MATQQPVETPVDTEATKPLIVNEVNDEPVVGTYVGQCKWFNDRLGFGFCTITQGDDKGKDIFVHHTGIKPLNSNYKTLNKGEYVNFNIISGENGLQAVDVTGIGGGSLMCDVVPSKRNNFPSGPVIPRPTQLGPRKYRTPKPQDVHSRGFTTVTYKKKTTV